MDAASAAAELDALAQFYGALAARQHYGDHVCMAAQPSEANGSVEELVDRGVAAGAEVTGRWARQIAEAVSDKSSESSILTALGSLHFDLGDLARTLEHGMLQSAMLGALDSEWERTHDEDIAPARFGGPEHVPGSITVRFAAQVEGAFSSLPFADAARLFDARQVLPRAAFDALEQGAKRQAFTVAGMASQQMLVDTRAELARQLHTARQDGKGFDLRTFRKFAADKLESAGWTPANPSHTETIFRTNAMGALASGRFVEMRQPAVLAALPFWQIRGVNDSRARPTHKAAFGIVLPANHPFWLHAYPPFGYNCLLPGTAVRGNFVGASRARYAGKAIELTTAKGRRLSVTANHPVLTRRGFVSARELREGDELVCDRGEAGVADLGRRAEGDEHHAPAAVEQVFGTLAKTQPVDLARPGADDFHGEARLFRGEVEVVGAYRELLLGSQATIGQQLRQLTLETAYALALSKSPALEALDRILLPAAQRPRFPALALHGSPVALQRPPFDELRVALPSELDAVLTEDASEGLTSDAQLVGELLQRGAALVALDQVRSVREFDFCGHVYDLQTTTGWMIGSGIVIGNCRCRVTSRTKAWIERNGVSVGPVPKDLPDPGFECGTSKMLLPVPDKALAPPAPKPVAPAEPAHPPWLHPLKPPALEPAPLPSPLPPPVPVVEPMVLVPTPPPAAPPSAPEPFVPPPFVPAAPRPPIHVPPTNSAANILGRKVADATGSNPGGVYEGVDRKQRYVKFYTDPAQAFGEKVANELYGALGFGHLESTTFEHGGQIAYASELVPGVKTLEQKGLTPVLAKKALEGFAADVLLANWDAAGLTLDNIVVTPKGKVIRIDNGGALLSRAKQGRKPAAALANVTEWTKFFDPKVNPGYAKLAQAAGVTSAEELGASLEKGIKKILALKKKSGGWGKFVAEHAGELTKHDQQQMALMLEERTAFLEQKLAELKKPKPEPGTVREWSKLPARPLPVKSSRPVPGVAKHEWLDTTARRIRKTLDSQQLQAVQSFTGAGYGPIRKAARLTEDEWVQASGAGGAGENTARAKYRLARAAAEAIEQGFKAAAATARQSLEAALQQIYRGVGGLSANVFDHVISAKELVFAAPASTSWDVDVAKSFADRHGGNRVIFVFKPKAEFADRRLAVDALSAVGDGEAEVLARAGSSWRVVDVVQRADDPLASGGGKCAVVYCEETEFASAPIAKGPGPVQSLRAPGSSDALTLAQTS